MKLIYSDLLGSISIHYLKNIFYHLLPEIKIALFQKSQNLIHIKGTTSINIKLPKYSLNLYPSMSLRLIEQVFLGYFLSIPFLEPIESYKIFKSCVWACLSFYIFYHYYGSYMALGPFAFRSKVWIFRQSSWLWCFRVWMKWSTFNIIISLSWTLSIVRSHLILLLCVRSKKFL